MLVTVAGLLWGLAHRQAQAEPLIAMAVPVSHSVANATHASPIAVEDTLRAWASAWDRSDVEAYLAHYADDFVPTGGRSRAEWMQQRRERLQTQPMRHVLISDMSVRYSGELATARFTQHYVDMGLMSTAYKRVILSKRNGSWKIRQELVESEHAVRR
ncbi:YybH family protein [Uliginosibacterium sp. H1]|uniref:YybH family protein n=1 Tax=Uliginosibacterium sp. H1 TaxID=3114757 RepID=UPI002E186457|nr:nuclear transport factor 2 family protein [Uliginosibacterium sp. H1]